MVVDPKSLVLGLAVAAFCGESIAECPRGEWPCAVVEIDQHGRLWVDGRRGSIHEVLRNCTDSESDTAVIAPDFDAPLLAVASAWNELQDRGVHLHHLTPCDRLELRELFLLDPMAMCSALSERAHVPLSESVARCRPERDSPAESEKQPSENVTVESWIPFGEADIAARRHGALSRHEVAIVIRDYPRRPALILSSEHEFAVPPPTVGHEKDGRSCFYPKRAPKPGE